MRRCDWAGNDELMVRYHDTEWGVPKRDDRRLFESLVLDGAQAGLSWATILKKRENYRRALRRVRSGNRCHVRRLQVRRVARRLGDRPQSAEDRFGHRQREGARAGARGVRKLRRIHLGVCGRRADQELVEKRR